MDQEKNLLNQEPEAAEDSIAKKLDAFADTQDAIANKQNTASPYGEDPLAYRPNNAKPAPLTPAAAKPAEAPVKEEDFDKEEAPAPRTTNIYAAEGKALKFRLIVVGVVLAVLVFLIFFVWKGEIPAWLLKFIETPEAAAAIETLLSL